MATARIEGVGESPTRRWVAGIDWITYIVRDKEQSRELAEIARGIQRDYGLATDAGKPFRLMRYEGWRTPVVRLGRSGASSLLQVSGQVSAEAWTRMASLGGAPTRLDVQVSLQLPTSQPLFYKRFLRPSTRTTSPSRSSSPLRNLHLGSRGLALGTVGDRTKARYGRVYDKGVEQKSHPAGTFWRVELEAKHALARNLWRDLKGTRDVQQWAYDSLSEQWRLSGCCWPLSESTRGVRGVSAYEPRVLEEQRSFHWMRRSVAPVIQRLLRKYSAADLRRLLDLEAASDFPESQADDRG